MTKQLLIYEQVTPVSSERHRGWSVKAGSNFAFARDINSVPLTTIEFARAATNFPIVFAGAGEEIVPVVLLGLREAENLYVDEEGTWTAPYVPAFLRRYPFVFSSSAAGKGENGETEQKEVFMLCIDESFEGSNEEGLGERLFDAEGERTLYLNGVLGFQQDYRAQSLRTRAFCDKLRDLELFEPMEARIGQPSGQPIALRGFQGIQRKKLYELPEDKLGELSVTGELELAYIHLQSLNNINSMAKLAGFKDTESEGNSEARTDATE